MMLNELAKKINENAITHGFYDDEKVNIPEKLMLIVSELGEAMEAYRKEHYCTKINWPDDITDNDFELLIKDRFEDELADTLIRILDLCAYMKIDIDKHVELKHNYNVNRPYKHGKIC
jgi:NTP pyrophosphatase (non-canonical NTP hydrolase)